MPLTDEQLQKLSTQRLLNLLAIARTFNSGFEWEETDDDKEERLNYFERIKRVLDTRPHHNREKRKPSKYDRVTRMR